VLQEQLGGASEKPGKLHPAAPKDKDRTRDPGNKKLTLKNDPKAGTKFAAKSEAKAATKSGGKSDGNRANHARKLTSDKPAPKSSPRKPR